MEHNLENSEWLQKYRDYTADNLAVHNVIHITDKPYVLVHEAHPLVELLRFNSETLGLNIDGAPKIDADDTPKIDGEWFRVSKQVLECSCTTIIRLSGLSGCCEV